MLLLSLLLFMLLLLFLAMIFGYSELDCTQLGFSGVAAVAVAGAWPISVNGRRGSAAGDGGAPRFVLSYFLTRVRRCVFTIR